MKTINFAKRRPVLHPEKPFQCSFRFETIFEPGNPGNAHAANHFIREVELHCLGKVDGLFRYGAIVDEFAGKSFETNPFLRKIASAFGTIVMKISEQGTITEVCNFFQLKEQWAEVKTRLLDDHRGTECDLRLAANDAVLAQEKRLIDFLQQPEMFGLYFNGLWQYTAQDPGRDLWTSGIHKKWLTETSFRLHKTSGVEQGAAEQATYIYERGILADALVCSERVAGTIKYIASCVG